MGLLVLFDPQSQAISYREPSSLRLSDQLVIIDSLYRMKNFSLR